MAELHETINALQARMLQKRLYVVLTTAVKSMSEFASLLPGHLNYMIDLEKRGILFASGPFLASEQVAPGSGMTILRAASLEEAKADRRARPFQRIWHTYLRDTRMATQRGQLHPHTSLLRWQLFSRITKHHTTYVFLLHC